ncbi:MULTISPECIES: hypothetical protein [Catenuloplanes]|uniref:Uncharacterized protein n=1 Tax=Catenuloplanes niger TaxID=587534 RepID=A0AAE3ZX84_9ACTN|nr:hypothetical protein [Catenuloplanes niger]MDR7326829.1 hypothetical protein [Catenuloplanes niger]
MADGAGHRSGRQDPRNNRHRAGVRRPAMDPDRRAAEAAVLRSG